MNRKWLALIVLWLSGLGGFGCGNRQKLLSISVTPTTGAFLSPDAALNIQLTATGTYVHPPATKDLTDQVTWTSDVPQLVTVSSTGLISPAGTGNCGVANITASLLTNDPKGNVVSNAMTVTVDNTNNPICPHP